VREDDAVNGAWPVPGTQSALIVEVPEAESAVAGLRAHLDASAPLGIPAHFTVLYPFMPPSRVDAGYRNYVVVAAT
jgi:hypothetical protein